MKGLFCFTLPKTETFKRISRTNQLLLKLGTKLSTSCSTFLALFRVDNPAQSDALQKEKKAVSTLKNNLTKAPVLGHPNYDLLFFPFCT